MSDIAELLERVKKAEGPSALLDGELYATIGGAPHTTTSGGRTIPFIAKGDPREYPAYTASIDAALALVERKLPGASWSVRTAMEGGYAADVPFVQLKDMHPLPVLARTAPLAILAALLTALHNPGDAP